MLLIKLFVALVVSPCTHKCTCYCSWLTVLVTLYKLGFGFLAFIWDYMGNSGLSFTGGSTLLLSDNFITLLTSIRVFIEVSLNSFSRNSNPKNPNHYQVSPLLPSPKVNQTEGSSFITKKNKLFQRALCKPWLILHCQTPAQFNKLNTSY